MRVAESDEHPVGEEIFTRLEEKSARVFLAAGEILDLRRLVSRNVRAVSAEHDRRLRRAFAANAYDRLVADIDVRRVRVPVH